MRKRKQYYAALLGLLGIAVVGTGISFGVTTQKKREKPKTNVVLEQPSEIVLKNQTPKTEFVAPKKVEEPKKVETKPVFSEETDTRQAGIFQREALFEMPVVGEILMDYSMGHGIYDVTLDQYRTNAYLSIHAEEGEKVCASEDGVVETVLMDEERGRTIVIDHKNGWKTTYSQLDDELDVEKGDNVKKGEPIGRVTKPTKYGVALGPHLDFAMSKDGEYVDPKSVLTE